MKNHLLEGKGLGRQGREVITYNNDVVWGGGQNRGFSQGEGRRGLVSYCTADHGHKEVHPPRTLWEEQKFLFPFMTNGMGSSSIDRIAFIWFIEEYFLMGGNPLGNCILLSLFIPLSEREGGGENYPTKLNPPPPPLALCDWQVGPGGILRFFFSPSHPGNGGDLDPCWSVVGEGWYASMVCQTQGRTRREAQGGGGV